ncbi:glycosyltransferase family 39 protein [Paenibacillus sp. sgz500958]|uniref:glycosyltransferase family 39 protein n=1 Tax=Paenibacillus sp. sgz500958 TaxID=3242475 RepID=UPI0036D3660F
MKGIVGRWIRACRANPLPVVFFLIGAVVRLLYIGSIPGGLNQDEASIGYDAYAILHYGIDRNGISLPIHLISWGSGQNALYAYLSIPFIWLFGLTPLSVRAVSIVMGLIGMLLFYLCAKAVFKSPLAGTTAMFFIAINPWHMMMSRWALESNIFPTLILIAVYCLLRSIQSPKWAYGFTVFAAMSLYAYGTAYFFVPVFVLCAAVYLLYKRVLTIRIVFWNALLFAFLAVPILLFIMINHWNLQGITLPFMSIPRLTMPRVEEISSVFGGDLLSAAGANFQVFLKLLISGGDGLAHNTIEPFGFAYPIALPFALMGLIVMTRSLFLSTGESVPEALVLIWITTSVGMAFITEVNVNRMNIFFYPFLLLVVQGFLWLFHKAKPAGIISAVAFSLCFALFTMVYFRDYPQSIDPAFYQSFGEAVQYASEESEGKVYVTDHVNMPYIYVLFYEKINPHDFAATVEYVNPGEAFQRVSSFGKYVFGQPGITLGEKAAYIFWNGDNLPAVNGEYLIRRFANYTVIITR